MDDVAALSARTLPSKAFWTGKRVFVTGHTGFKGGWLTLWLHELGAVVSGYSLPPERTPNLFSICRVMEFCEHQFADVRNAAMLNTAIAAFQPDIVFHLAAQPLVRASYVYPMETFATNVMGTVNLLDAVKHTPSVAVTIVVTSDKVYSQSSTHRHEENGRLGGHDPYSASKACAELVTASFPFPAAQKIATVRSGNVIGGGDWAEDRLLPDFFRSVFEGKPWKIRNPHAIRPWQHVLDPLCGYLVAAEYLWTNQQTGRETWNFGPDTQSEISVATIATRLCHLWGDGTTYNLATPTDSLHEAPVLRLNSGKARHELNWRPGWDLGKALAATASWFRKFRAKDDMAAFTKSQIETYCKP